MNKIIVPTDFSKCAYNALEYALAIAEKTGAEIHVINAYSLPSGGSTVMVDISDVLRKNAMQELGGVEETLKERGVPDGVDLKYRAEYGSLVDVIEMLCRHEDFDLVVMGTTGASGFEKYLGSNAAAVVREVPIPVFSVPCEVKFKGLDELLFLTDFKKIDQKTNIQILSQLAEAFNSHIRLLHVRTGDDGITEKEKEEYRNEAEKILPGHELKYSFVHASTVEGGIEQVLDSEKPNALVLVKHEYGFFEGLFHHSVTREMLLKCKASMLVIKD